MKVEFLDDISDGGRYPNADPDKLIRLYAFDSKEASEFRDSIKSVVINEQKSLVMSSLSFVELVDCNLTFRISETDHGISTINNKDFYCDLTLELYKNMVYIMEPFCVPDDKGGYNWLYDLDTPIDLLFSPGGTW